ncbi:hypothetical protein GCM10010140_43950 [Streptosporangium pseudovulgare]|uniref:Uncharacterized protein n=1 Tax=Streptosporangium pseudovulgare TaxID=35765 RepID=A0ABQ2R426_9ACTN|nr:hypothetical protein GCM10010140_43950 [Streptosporangium pseudovulgare]
MGREGGHTVYVRVLVARGLSGVQLVISDCHEVSGRSYGNGVKSPKKCEIERDSS